MTSDLRSILEEIHERRGELTPALVVEEARDPAHPLHSRFEWDDSIAAEAWRRDQAHRLIQKVKCVYREATDLEPERSVRAFQAVRKESGVVAYEPSHQVVRDPITAQLVLREMERDWQTLRRRYEAFSEFWSMVRNDAGEAA